MNNFSYAIGPSGAVSYQPLVGTSPAGHVGEHNALSLTFNINSAFCPDASYYRLAFGTFISDELYAEDNAVTYTVPQTLTQGKLLTFQLSAYVVDDGVLTGVVKSDIISIELNESHRGTESVSGEAVDAITSLTNAARTARDEAVTAANSVTESAAAAAVARDGAVSAASNAAASATNASLSASAAEFAKGRASESASNAAASATAADSAKSDAETAAASAATAKTDAETAATNAASSATAAATAKTGAETAATAAASSATAAASAKSDAETAATAAASSATAAESAKDSAVNSAASASTSAASAATARGSAVSAANSAASAKTDAQTAATNAAQSATAAATAKTGAETAASDAAQSATAATNAAAGAASNASAAIAAKNDAISAKNDAVSAAANAAASAVTAAGYAVDSVEVDGDDVVISYSSGTTTAIAHISDILSDSGVKRRVETTYSVSTPIWTIQPTLSVGSADALTLAPDEFYFVHRITPQGSFQLYKVKNDAASVVTDSASKALTFVCTTTYYSTGNDGMLYEGDAIEVVSVSPDVVLRRAGLSTLTCPLVLASTYDTPPTDIRISICGGLVAGTNIRTSLLATNTDAATCIESQYDNGTLVKGFNNSGNLRSDMSAEVTQGFFTKKYRRVVGRYDVDSSLTGWASRFVLSFNQCDNPNMIIAAADAATCNCTVDRLQTGYVVSRAATLGEQLKTVNITVVGTSRCLCNGFTAMIREMG